jgi:hypothetical protein
VPSQNFIIADSIKSRLEIVPVSRMDEVLARAMTRKPELLVSVRAQAVGLVGN